MLEGEGYGLGVTLGVLAPVPARPWTSQWTSQCLSFLTYRVERRAATLKGDWNDAMT